MNYSGIENHAWQKKKEKQANHFTSILLIHQAIERIQSALAFLGAEVEGRKGYEWLEKVTLQSLQTKTMAERNVE